MLYEIVWLIVYNKSNWLCRCCYCCSPHKNCLTLKFPQNQCYYDVEICEKLA